MHCIYGTVGKNHYIKSIIKTRYAVPNNLRKESITTHVFHFAHIPNDRDLRLKNTKSELYPMKSSHDKIDIIDELYPFSQHFILLWA